MTTKSTRRFTGLKYLCILVTVFAPCSSLLACKVSSVSLYVGTTAEEAAGQSKTSIDIPVGDKAYFYATCDVGENPAQLDIKWEFDLDGDGVYGEEGDDYSDSSAHNETYMPVDDWVYGAGRHDDLKVRACLNDGEDNWATLLEEDYCDVDVVTVASVVWQTYPDDVNVPAPETDHGPNLELESIEEGTPPVVVGYKIYPGKKHYEDYCGTIDNVLYDEPGMRRKVTVKATVSPAAEDMTVYFSWWDVDDPSNSLVIDENDDPDDDDIWDGNYGDDNKGSGESLSATSAQTDANGDAEVTFTASMQPGDNFKIAASISSTRLAEMTQTKADAREDLPDNVVMSDALTTWRKLWIERDSMGPVATTGGHKNHVVVTSAGSYSVTGSGTTARTTITFSSGFPVGWGKLDHFKYGYMEVAGFSPYSIRASDDPTIGNGWVKVQGDLRVPGNPIIPFECKLYDDDYDNTISPHITLPDYTCSVGDYQDAYDAAYIKVDYLDTIEASSSDQVSFDLNQDELNVAYGLGDWNNSYDVSSTSDFWTQLVVAAYQGEFGEDYDPDSESSPCPGMCNGSNEAVLYLEVIREHPLGLDQIMAHEVSHGGGTPDHDADYPHECIMRPGAGDSLGEIFCNSCLNEMRKDPNW